MGLPNMFVMLILQVVLLISGLLSSLVGGLLNFIISPDFIRWSYTRPGDPSVDPTNNPVILAGLSVTQSFVNMILVLILVYIAFQTILRIGGVKTQKLLVNLVIIALLINFAPVLIGLVVDASNILMHYFTAPLTGSKNFINTLNDIGNNLATYFTSGMLSLTKQLDIIMQTVVLIVFNFVLIMILGMFCLIFIARYVAIWMLVILSPLAFVAYILPQTKKFFDQWLNQLMQWCFIGVTGGFFLYLAEKVQESVQTLNIKFDSGFVFFNALLPNIIPLIFIVAGFILSLKTGAMGADKIVEFGKKAGKNVGNFAARRSKAFIGDKIPKDVRQSLQGLASSANPAWGKSQKGISGWAKRTMASVVGDAQRTVGISGMRGITKSEQEAAKTAHDEAMKRGVDENLGVMRTRGKTKAEKAAIISAIMDKKQIGHATDDKFVTSPLSDEEMIDAYGYYTQAEDSDAIEKLEGGNIRNKTGILKEFARIKDATTANFLSTDPDKLIGGIDEDDRKEYGTLQNKIIARAKSEEDIKQLQKGWWKDSALMEAANKFWEETKCLPPAEILGETSPMPSRSLQMIKELIGILILLRERILLSLAI